MKKKRKFYTRHPIDYSKHLPEFSKSWTKSDRALYNLVYSFAVNGCWMSNTTIGKILHRCRRTIQLSRQHLNVAGIIIMARTNPRTWSMWAALHPAVVCSKRLYFKGGEILNPYYRPSGAQNRGAQKLRPGGAKDAPKREECIYPTDIYSKAGALKGNGPRPAAKQSQGARPPNPPAGSGGLIALTTWQKNHILQRLQKISWKQLEIELENWKWSPAKIASAEKLSRKNAAD